MEMDDKPRGVYSPNSWVLSMLSVSYPSRLARNSGTCLLSMRGTPCGNHHEPEFTVVCRPSDEMRRKALPVVKPVCWGKYICHPRQSIDHQPLGIRGEDTVNTNCERSREGGPTSSPD